MYIVYLLPWLLVLQIFLDPEKTVVHQLPRGESHIFSPSFSLPLPLPLLLPVSLFLLLLSPLLPCHLPYSPSALSSLSPSPSLPLTYQHFLPSVSPSLSIPLPCLFSLSPSPSLHFSCPIPLSLLHPSFPPLYTPPSLPPQKSVTSSHGSSTME